MPEIAEVARIVHYLKKHVAGRTITSVLAKEDNKVFDKTTHDKFIKAMKGNKVVDIKQLGKNFWMVMEKAPHPLMHLGMSGWIVFRQDPSSHYRSKPDDPKPDWPPKYDKFILSFDGGKAEDDIAFIDPRRFARIKLIDCDGDKIREKALKDNGPDPIVDGFDEDWFTALTKKRKVPVKAFLLDQKAISGVGNWVGDEILYHARIHPEQYCDTLSPDQLHALYENLMYVCRTAVEVLGDASKFPDHWLMTHRWAKGKSGVKMPNGERIDFVKVGGRTSAFVKTRQKATGGTAVPAKDADMVVEDDDEEAKGASGKKGSSKAKATPKKEKATVTGRKRVKEESDEEGDDEGAFDFEVDDDEESEDEKPAKKRKSAAPTPKKQAVKKEAASKKATPVKKEETPKKLAAPKKEATPGSRRSSRLQK